MKITELPRYEGIANDMGDFFIPTDAKDDEMLIRAGRIKSAAEGVVECVIAYTNKNSEWGWNLSVWGKYADGWSPDKDMVSNDEFRKIVENYIQNQTV